MEQNSHTTIDEKEVEHFSRISSEWWDPSGKFRPLHQINPVRLAYIKTIICQIWHRDALQQLPLEGLRILDIGCGGGLLCEPLARLGATMVGIDMLAANIQIAEIHAKENGLDIDYRVMTAEHLQQTGEKFDIVLNMEVVEHVANVKLFMASTAAMVKESGLMFVATLNRTFKAWALAIIGAEYILGWLPKGTHSYDKFLRPEELESELVLSQLQLIDKTGIVYHPFASSWTLSTDMDVNYMIVARAKGFNSDLPAGE